ncbi:UNVERIFIED_CONTAM: hypothetical protein NQD88_17280 [Escherichia coli]|nr:hypothetical protein [Escherichia coli]
MHFTTFLKKHFDIEFEQEYFIKPNEQKRWIVGNVYSTLEHGKEYSEKELINIIKSGNFIK